jgi:hypothetical protein
MSRFGWMHVPNADISIKMDLLDRGQRYCPKCGIQLNPENCEVYKRAFFSTSSDYDLTRRLTKWRNKKGEELGVTRFQSGSRVISRAIIFRLVNTRPINVEELRDVYALGPKKIEEFGAEILAIIRAGNHPEKDLDIVHSARERTEGLSQQLDELMLFCRNCSDGDLSEQSSLKFPLISAATWPQNPKPGSQIARPSGGIECVIIRVDTGDKISDHFHIFP